MGDPLSGTVESPLLGHLCIILMLGSFVLWNSVIPQFILTIIRVIPSEMSMTGVALHLWWPCLSRKSSAGNFWYLCCLRALVCIFGYKFILKSEELQCGVAEVSNPTSADTKWYIHPIPCTPYTQYTIYPAPHIHNIHYTIYTIHCTQYTQLHHRAGNADKQ